MASVIYVHGVGVREQAYQETFGLIKEHLRIPGIDFKPCFWGGQFGAKLNADGLSIPVPDIIKAFGDLNTDDDETTALWELLYSDPLCELSAIAMNPEENSKVINFSEEPLNVKLSYEFQNRKFSNKYLQKLAIVGLRDVFEKAYMDTIDSPAFKSALGINPKVIDSERQVIARAVIAKALNMCENHELSLRIMYDTALRDELVASLTDEFGGISKGLSGFILKPLFGLAKSIATNYAVRKRRTISAQLYETPGDVLVYMARGNEIRAYIRHCIEKSQGPVILLAHSLGGVACVDLLVLEHIPCVKLLVTMGTQVPLFYELDVLISLRYGKPLPQNFPGWINLFNQRDFLSYVGSALFPGRVEDMEVKSRQPFPQTHNALSYLSNEATWNTLMSKIQNACE